MEQRKPNILLIMTDQQRADTVGALVASYMRTPNIDRLVETGISFTNTFTTSPSCVPARASLFTGYYIHNTNVLANGDRWSPTWIQTLADAGYQCVNIGKMHTIPLDSPGGFHERFIVENKDRHRHLETPDRAFFDEWDKYLANNDLEKPSRETYKRDLSDFDERLGAFVWPLSEKDHPDTFVGNMALWWLCQRRADCPLFLQIGFPGPHPPYDPVKEYINYYIEQDLPLPVLTEEELKGQPPPHHDYRDEMINYHSSKDRGPHDSVEWTSHPTPKQLHRLRAYYYANVTMIDRKIGEILDLLHRKGELDNTIVVFTSDHGDALGDNGHIEKWMMYDSMVKVPLVISAPRLFKGGRRTGALVQLMDLAPTFLEAANLTVPREFDARSLMPLLRDETSSIRDYAFSEGAPLWYDPMMAGPEKEGEIGRDRGDGTGFVTMIRSERYKLVHYLGEAYGELYDLQSDPGEHRNEWGNRQYAEIKNKMLADMFDWKLKSYYTAAASALPNV